MSVPINVDEQGPGYESIRLKSYSVAKRGTDFDFDPVSKDYTIYWRDLKYSVFRGVVDQAISKILGHNVPKSRMVLKGVSGSFVAGQMTALMGPSGAGKTTLLECLIGRRQTGLSGVISCRDHDKVKMAVIPQQEQFFNVLTARETLMYASRLQNATRDMDLRKSGANVQIRRANYHEKIVNSILKRLDLMNCADNEINSCSGSQKKRLSIGQELVCNPNLLVLDEPTTGLDAVAALAVCEYLLKLATSEPKIAVIMTIHQPSQRVFSLFHKVYMLSNVTGTCIYEGPPNEVIEYLSNFDYQCPEQYNPGDYLTEVAAGIYGHQKLNQLTSHHDKQVALELDSFQEAGSLLADLLRPGTFPFWTHVWILSCRIAKMTIRDPWAFWTQALNYIVMAFLAWGIFGKVGGPGGCPPKIKDNLFDPSTFEQLAASIKVARITTIVNAGNIFFSLIISSILNMMPIVFSVAHELLVTKKEKDNNWYGSSCYFVARTLTDIPISVTLAVLFCSLQYHMNDEITDDLWRFVSYTANFAFLGLVAQSQGHVIAFLLANSQMAALFLAPVSIIPLTLISGFFIGLPAMSNLMSTISVTCYLRFAFEGCIVSLYGHDRCGEDIEEYFTTARGAMAGWLTMVFEAGRAANGGAAKGDVTVDMVQVDSAAVTFSGSIVNSMLSSFVGADGEIRPNIMNRYDLKDSDMNVGYGYLAAMVVLYKLFAYFIVMRKLNERS